MITKRKQLDKSSFVARARFRHQLRLFERFTEEADLAARITATQYLLLLHIKGRPERDLALVGDLAKCLVMRHHTTVELVSRCEAAGLVRREKEKVDQRKVRVLLTRCRKADIRSPRIPTPRLGSVKLNRLAHKYRNAIALFRIKRI